MLTPFLPQSFELFGLTFNLYGLFLGLGGVVILNTLYSKYKEKLTLWDYLLLLLGALIGARGLFLTHNILKLAGGEVSALALSSGGLALYGALVGVLIAAVVISVRRKIPLLRITDALFLNFPLAQSFGRIGNFFNFELYGRPTNLPWAVNIPEQHRLEGYEGFASFHPVFLYEIILNLFNWVLLRSLAKNKKVKDGTITFVFLLVYGVIRLLMNTLRIDKEFILGVETSNLLAILFIGISAFSLFIIYANSRYEKKFATIVSWGLNAYMTQVLPVLIAIAYDFNNIERPFLLGILILLLPSSLLAVFWKLKLINDLDISDRDKRPLFMVVATLVYLGYYFLVLTTGSILLIKVVLSLLIISAFFTIVSTFWKISGHMTYLLFAITSINYISGDPKLLYLYLLVPLVAWARVRLKHHTPTQTIIGTAAAMLMCLTFFYLL